MSSHAWVLVASASYLHFQDAENQRRDGKPSKTPGTSSRCHMEMVLQFSNAAALGHSVVGNVLAQAKPPRTSLAHFDGAIGRDVFLPAPFV